MLQWISPEEVSRISQFLTMSHYNDNIHALVSRSARAQLVGDYESARADLMRAFKIASMSADRAMMTMIAADAGALFDRIDRLDQAAEYWQVAVAASPSDPWNYLGLVRAYERLGRIDLATRVLEACDRVARHAKNREVLEIIEKKRGDVPRS